MTSDFASLIDLSEGMASALRQLQLADVEESIEEPAADEARQVLRWLNNLPSADMPLDEWLDTAAPDDAVARATNLSQLVKSFIRKLKRARKKRPDILREATIENATHAAAAMTQAVINYTLSRLPGHPKAAALEAALAALPPEARMRQTQSVRHLTGIVETGMEHASGQNISGKSPYERLASLSTRMRATARTLRSIDSLEPPAREESIELAREILRKLKNMSFSDKSVKEMIDAGRPEDRVDFAEAIEEMADMYKNLLQEATETNPELLRDKQVQEAGEAVSTFAHAIKLMAAKEMPSSIAAAQQIAADATHNPAEWNQLNDRTVGRLLKSMEGALEKAVGGIESDQAEQQRQEEQAQEMADTALQQADTSKRKKRRKRRSNRSGGGKKQQKEKMALEADDYVLKQGRFGRDAQTARGEPALGMPGLNPDAMAAIRQLGGTLLNLGKQAKNISVATDKIVPDDKTVSQRVIEEQQRNPKNQGPRV